MVGRSCRRGRGWRRIVEVVNAGEGLSGCVRVGGATDVGGSVLVPISTIGCWEEGMRAKARMPLPH